MRKPNLIWIDLEMTGLDLERNVILEIAAVVTSGDLEIVAEGPSVAIRHPERVFSRMEAWSGSQHKKSGLLDRARNSPYTCAQAEERVLAFLSRHCRKGKSPLCGNTIWQDRRFMIKYMPTLEAFCHYRNIDVSSIKELVKRWYPTLPAYKKKKAHLALSDIKESINELRYYRDTVFIDIERRRRHESFKR
jgi:oligoribonuclease